MTRYWAAGRTLNGQEGVERPREHKEIYAVFKVNRHRAARVVTAAKTAPNGKERSEHGTVASSREGAEWSGGRGVGRKPRNQEGAYWLAGHRVLVMTPGRISI